MFVTYAEPVIHQFLKEREICSPSQSYDLNFQRKAKMYLLNIDQLGVQIHVIVRNIRVLYTCIYTPS